MTNYSAADNTAWSRRINNSPAEPVADTTPPALGRLGRAFRVWPAAIGPQGVLGIPLASATGESEAFVEGAVTALLISIVAGLIVVAIVAIVKNLSGGAEFNLRLRLGRPGHDRDDDRGDDG
ncbi:MAG: hypothetical protein AAGA65_30665 [Actinomycetota bacterium]